MISRRERAGSGYACWTALSTADLRNQIDLAARLQFRSIRILKYLAVDSDRHAFLDLLAQAGKAPFQFQNQPAEVGRLHLEFRLTVGELPGGGTRGEDDLRHEPLSLG